MKNMIQFAITFTLLFLSTLLCFPCGDGVPPCDNGDCPSCDDGNGGTTCKTCDSGDCYDCDDGSCLEDHDDGKCPPCGGSSQSGTGTKGNKSLSVSINLGKSLVRNTTGRMSLKVEEPSDDMFSANSFKFSRSEDYAISYGEDGITPSNIAHHQCGVEFTDFGNNHLEISFYKNKACQNNDFRIVKCDMIKKNIPDKSLPNYHSCDKGDLFTKWILKKSDTDSNKYTVIRQVGDMVEKSTFVWDPNAKGWQLEDEMQNHLVRKKMIVDDDFLKQEIKEIEQGGQVKYTEMVQREDLGWGALVDTKEIKDVGGLELTTSYEYYTDISDNGYTKLERKLENDGSYIRYEYDDNDRIKKEISPWKDGETQLIKESFYTSHHFSDDVLWDDHRPRTVTESIEGNIIKKEFYAYYTKSNGDRVKIKKVATNLSANYDDLNNLTTIKTYYPTNDPISLNRDSIKTITHPDGRMDSYTYEIGDYSYASTDGKQGVFTPNETGIVTKVVITHGIEDGPFSGVHKIPFKTTREIKIFDAYSDILEHEVQVYGNMGFYSTLNYSVHKYNEFNQETDVWYSDGTSEHITWSIFTGEKESFSDRSGTRTTYTYYDKDKIKTETKEGANDLPDIVTEYSYDHHGNVLTQKTIIDGIVQKELVNEYDTAGRLEKTTDEKGLETKYDYATTPEGGKLETVTFPGGATRITAYYLDGQIKSITGTSQISQYYNYDFDGIYLTETIYTGASDSPRYTQRKTDAAGLIAEEIQQGYETPIGTTYTYNEKGQLTTIQTTGQPAQITEYDEMGQIFRTGIDVDSDGSLTLASNDRISEQNTLYEIVDNAWYLKTEAISYPHQNDATPVTVRTTLFSPGKDGCNTCSGTSGTLQGGYSTISRDIHNNETTISIIYDAVNKTVTQTTTYPDNSTMTRTTINGLLVSEKSRENLTTIYKYDDLERLEKIIYPGERFIEYGYENHYLKTEKDNLGNTTTHNYDPDSGRRTATENALTKTTMYRYNDRGQITLQYGNATYPVRYHYNNYGEMTQLHTYREVSNPMDETTILTSQADITKWNYHQPTGLLLSKTDAKGKSVTYTYHNDGKLKTRTWARGTTTTYEYYDTGELQTVDYSDTTPDITYTYLRDGRIHEITDATGLRAFGYNAQLQLETEQLPSGQTITRKYQTFGNILGRPYGLKLDANYDITYNYDNYNRLETIETSINGAAQHFEYQYHPQNGLIQTLDRYYEGDGVFLQNNTYDDLNRLSSISYSPSAINYGYTYNALHQRTRQDMPDGGHWIYEYDDKGQLQTATRYNASGQALPGQYANYTYDQIGNRKTAQEGENLPSRNATYTANALNQYTQREVPPYLDVIGTASSSASVTVNRDPADNRIGDYFHKAHHTENTYESSQEDLYILAKIPGAGTDGTDLISTDKGSRFLPQHPETFQYDTDGNLTRDGRWIYTWNAENRLVKMQTRPDILHADIPNQKIEFSYDYMGRRISKTLDGETTHFIYDGWNVIYETQIGGTGVSSVKYCIWGLDLSQTQQGAGGVGGLLSVIQNASTYYPFFDANGNITHYTDDTGQIVAHREYASFGQTLVSTGEKKNDFAHWFSTKYEDSETDLYYYGFRYYNPHLGRWLNRDPIGELGGINQYHFVFNNPLSWVDILGLQGSSGPNCGCDSSGNQIQPVTDDAGRQCCPNQLQSVSINNANQGLHTFVQTPTQTSGFYAQGWGQGNSSQNSSTSSSGTLGTVPGQVRSNANTPGTPVQTYSACPGSVNALNQQINNTRQNPGNYNALNTGAHNCTGQACSWVQGAGFTPPANPNQPGLLPPSITPPAPSGPSINATYTNGGNSPPTSVTFP